MATFEHDGRHYAFEETLRVDLNAFMIELIETRDGEPHPVASLMCRDGSRELLVSADFPGLPAALVERLIALGRTRLPHWDESSDANWQKRARAGDGSAEP